MAVWVCVLPLQLTANNHFFQLHYVGMSEPQQQGDLSEAADGHPWQDQEESRPVMLLFRLCTCFKSGHSSHMYKKVTMHNNTYDCMWNKETHTKSTALKHRHMNQSIDLTIFLFVHADLLQSHNLIWLGVSSSVYRRKKTVYLLTSVNKVLFLIPLQTLNTYTQCRKFLLRCDWTSQTLWHSCSSQTERVKRQMAKRLSAQQGTSCIMLV